MKKLPTLCNFTYFTILTNFKIIKTSYHGAPTDSQLGFRLIYHHPRNFSVFCPAILSTSSSYLDSFG